MFKLVFLYLMAIFSVIATAFTQEQPPLAVEKVVKDTYFGEEIEDPYRYMEQLDDPEVQNWMRAQADYTRTILDRIKGREELIDQMKELDQRKSATVTQLDITENDQYFYLKRLPEDETGKLYTRDGYEGVETLLFDPTQFRPEEEKQYVINGISPNADGSMIGLVVSPNGSENGTILIIDVKKKLLLDEQIDPVWLPSISWLADGQSFLYLKMNVGDIHDTERILNNKVFIHHLGADLKTDREIFSNATHPELDIKPEELPFVYYDHVSNKLFGSVFTVAPHMKIYVAQSEDLEQTKIEWTQLFELEDEVVDIRTDESYIYAYTSKDAPNFKLTRIALDKLDVEQAEVVIPEPKDAVFFHDPYLGSNGFVVNQDAIYYTLVRNGVETELYRLEKGETQPVKLELPQAAGAVSLVNKDARFEDIWINLGGWTTDNRRYRFLPEENIFQPESLSAEASYPELDNLVVKEVRVSSHDGVKVPLSIIHRKDLELDGQHPTLMMGYGAYGMSFNPYFNTDRLTWTLQGGVLAVAHVRGGGELGDEWYKAGYKTTKPNTWKDFIACAEYLHKARYSSPAYTAIMGVSAGGILAGRAMTERPDLFAAAIPLVGVMNPLRVEHSPNGPVNIPEFGTTQVEEEYRGLMEMDAYHHIEDGENYPATLITAGMNDPRVIAWQPAKFAARLQAANASENPILFWVDYQSGHGIGDTRSKKIESDADWMSFALWQTQHPDFELQEKGE